MWCLHLPPWTPLQFELCQSEAGCCINIASAHSMVLLQCVAQSICEEVGWFLGLPLLQNIDVDMCRYSSEQVVDGVSLLLVVRFDNAWHMTRVGN